MNSNTAVNFPTYASPTSTATAPSTPPIVIDMRLVESIRSLNSDGRPDLLAELVAIFKETTPELIDGLDACAASGDLRQLQRLAHRLKGGSGNVGARHMSRLCADLELFAKEAVGRSEELKTHITAIRQSYEEALGALRALL